MLKPKFAPRKLFDTKNIQLHTNCERQKRWCSCYHKSNKPNEVKSIQSVNNHIKLNDKVNVSCKENISVDSRMQNSPKSTDQVYIREFNTSIYSPSNSLIDNDDFNAINSEISSIVDTSNSSWNDASEMKMTTRKTELSNETQFNHTNHSIRNTFPIVLKKILPKYMNISRAKDNISIPIQNKYTINYSKGNIKSQMDKCFTVPLSETSIECDLDTDNYDYSNKSNYSVKNYSKNNKDKDLSGKSNKKQNNKLVLYAYIPDIKGIKDSLVLNKDRRFPKILQRYNCDAMIIQMGNLTKGFPHVLVKIESETMSNLNCMARDTDRSYPRWNLRSQLRSLHI